MDDLYKNMLLCKLLLGKSVDIKLNLICFSIIILHKTLLVYVAFEDVQGGG